MKKQLPVSLTRTETVTGWCWWIFQLFILQVILVTANWLLPQPLSDARLNFVFFCINFLALTVLLRKYLLASLNIALEKPGKTLLSALCGFLAYYGSSILVGILIVVVMPESFENLNDTTISGLAREDFSLTLVGTAVLVPVAEELMYRGVIFGSLYRRSPVVAYGVSILIFAAIHLLGYLPLYDPLSLLLSFLQYLPAGIFLGWAYAHSGTILAPILIHVAVNLIGVLSMR